MALSHVIEKTRPEAIRSLNLRASLANRLAKNTSSRIARQHLYQQKAQALSRLIVMGAGGVDECLVTRGLVTVSLANGRRLHVPIQKLSTEARAIVRATILSRLGELES